MTDEEQKKIFSLNLNRYINSSGKLQKEIATELGYSPTTFNTWCVGKIIPSTGKIQRIADYFHIGKSDLLDDKSQSTYTNGYKIPVLGSVPAGIPIDAIEDIIDYEEIDSATASKGEYFGLKVKGHSMEPRICEGDVLIVKRQDDCESGDIAIIMINGNDATVKRLMKYADGIRLLPNNPAYEPMYFTNEEIISKPVKIIGKVVENRQKY
jgi:repressor LexA